MITRRALMVAGGALVLSACHGGGARVLKVGSQKGGTKALMLASGALAGADYQIEWSEFPAAQNLLEALASNAVDIGLIGDAPYLFAYQTGKPLRAVAARIVQPKPVHAISILVPGGSGLHGVQDLKGQKIATTRGSIGHLLVLEALEKAGLAAKDVDLVFLTPSDAAAALHTGSVQAWSTWGPYVITGLAEGYRVLADGYDYHDGVGFDVVHENVLKDKPAILADFLAREARAMEWRRSHLDAYAKVLAQETGLPLAIARQTAAIAAQRDAPLTPQLVASQQVIFDIFARGGALAARRPLRDAYVLSAHMPKS
jgi:sulfonate transport system substrate-binding protein